MADAWSSDGAHLVASVPAGGKDGGGHLEGSESPAVPNIFPPKREESKSREADQ